jgi:hypothetical protein
VLPQLLSNHFMFSWQRTSYASGLSNMRAVLMQRHLLMQAPWASTRGCARRSCRASWRLPCSWPSRSSSPQ